MRKQKNRASIDPGRLRHRVMFYIPSATKDEYGEVDWEPGTSTWAAIDFVSGFNNLQGGEFTAQATHLITMRWRSGVVVGNQIRYGGRTFNIVYMDDVEGKRIELALYCLEVT